MGSSGRKNQTPIEMRKLHPYSVHSTRRFMAMPNTGRAMAADRLSNVRWDILRSSPQSAHMHMALDEVLLDRVIRGDRGPAIRFWEWIEPALVIGSHQSVANEVDAVAARELGFTVTRRMSGGGTMLCEPGRTITYSLYVPATIVSGLSFRHSYAALDAWSVRSL